MSVSISKAGPYFSSGSISFSSLRDTFRFTGGAISASELKRNTNINDSDPIVPDATENSSISSSSNLSLSQFRNSIKYYYITQSGTDESLSLQNSAYWNGNSGKNIRKTIYVTGTNGLPDITAAAIRYRGDQVTTYNLTIDCSGNVYGAGGLGGGDSSPLANAYTGTNGGSAFRVEGSGSGTGIISFIVRSSARIWAGGGGGERGAWGANGSNGYCPQDCSWRNTFCQGNAPDQSNCPGGTTYGGSRYIRCCESQGGGGCVRALWELTCCYPAYSTTGGTGGAGGVGGKGRGYDNFSGSLAGGAGASGTAAQSGSRGSCGATAGADGGTGGSGGEWGQSGQDTTGAGVAGGPGYAIFGSNFTISGSVNSTTVKGIIEYNF